MRLLTFSKSIRPKRFGECELPVANIASLLPAYFTIASSSRVDDVIVLSTGEKTVPGPLEDIVNTSPYVACSLIFGREQLQVGIIVQPKNGIDVDNAEVLSEYIDKIWFVFAFVRLPPRSESL